MRILVNITHPAHVHFFRHAIRIWQHHGHQVDIASRDKDVTTALLNNLGLRHRTLSRARTGLVGLGLELAIHSTRLLMHCLRRRPDIMTGIGGTFLAPVAWLLRIPSVGFTDTEHARIANAIAFPLLRAIVTPTSCRIRVGLKQYTYDGYHELAYLHPNRFVPDPQVLAELGVQHGEKFVVMRFVSWTSSHDVGHRGMTLANKLSAVAEFAKRARVFITSEVPLPEELDRYRIRMKPEQIHHALSYATLLYGESATMASECSLLGTPAIFLDDVGRGYTDEQEEVYGTVFNYSESLEDQERSIAKGVVILETADIKDVWAEKRRRLLQDKIDVTQMLVKLIEEYPKPLEDVRNSRHLSF